MTAKWCLAAALLWLGPTAMAFQSPGADAVAVAARVKRESHSNPGEAPRAELRVDVSLVEVPVHVTTFDGRPVTNLKPGNFRVLEDGVEQKITYFTRDDAPLSVGLLFDASGSMQSKIGKSAEAAESFVKTANPQDEFFLIEFSEKPKLAVPFTMNPEAIYRRITHMRPFGRTALLDAIHMALLQMKNARNPRKAVVIVSDGGDNRSRYTAREVKAAMRESDVQLYAMGIFDWPKLRSARSLPAEEQNGPRLLERIGGADRRAALPSGGFGRAGVDQRTHQPRPARRVRDRLFAEQCGEGWKVPAYPARGSGRGEAEVRLSAWLLRSGAVTGGATIAV